MLKLRYCLKKYNITAAENRKTAFILALPLLILPVLNLLPLFLHGFDAVQPVLMASVLLTLLWVLVEEILFRGFLPVAAMEPMKFNEVQCAIAVSAVFALFHFAGIIKGADVSYAAVQSILAFGAGFAFTALTFRSGSILPAAAIHFLLNLSADFCAGFSLPWLAWCGAALLCIIYGVYLLAQKRSH